MQIVYHQLDIPPARRSTSISQAEGEFIVGFLQTRKIKATLETGFAYGFSAAYIMAGTRAPHIAIDPYLCGYGDTGMRNIEKLGFASRFQLIEVPSHLALPQLVGTGLAIDFGFIDGGHLFEEIFVDWFYINLLLRRHAHVMFHDRWLEATQTIASFIRRNRPDYREIKIPLPNLYLFEKIGGEERDWRLFTTPEGLMR